MLRGTLQQSQSYGTTKSNITHKIFHKLRGMVAIILNSSWPIHEMMFYSSVTIYP